MQNAKMTPNTYETLWNFKIYLEEDDSYLDGPHVSSYFFETIISLIWRQLLLLHISMFLNLYSNYFVFSLMIRDSSTHVRLGI
jgi:hypothetical protein